MFSLIRLSLVSLPVVLALLAGPVWAAIDPTLLEAGKPEQPPLPEPDEDPPEPDESGRYTQPILLAQMPDEDFPIADPSEEVDEDMPEPVEGEQPDAMPDEDPPEPPAMEPSVPDEDRPEPPMMESSVPDEDPPVGAGPALDLSAGDDAPADSVGDDTDLVAPPAPVQGLRVE